VREGTANLFMIFEPLLGWRHVAVTERRTDKDFAEVLRWLAEDIHDEAEKLVLVTDNLNTDTPACPYEALPPEQARRLAAQLEWHHTPKHGSWLDIAEIELSALAKLCLDWRIGGQEELRREAATWGEERDERGGVASSTPLIREIPATFRQGAQSGEGDEGVGILRGSKDFLEGITRFSDCSD
jgi:hypothetical protein